MIKEKPEDFIVRELMELELDDSGEYTYYELTKTNITQEDAFKTICNKLNVKRKLINYAGTKDKKAITTQCISIFENPLFFQFLSSYTFEHLESLANVLQFLTK